MTNETMLKFNYPDSLIREYEHWAVLLRPAQVTIGSLVLAGRGEAERFPDLPRAAFEELKTVAGALENALSAAFGHDRINYLMLMMVDPHVHYHVIPRYSAPAQLNGRDYPDEDWPGPPDVRRALDLPDGAAAAIQERIASVWPA